MEKGEEIWKDIPNYEGLYQVSNLGNVKRIKRNYAYIGKNQFNEFNTNKELKDKILKPSIVCGYYRVRLTKNKRIKNIFIHRLVAKAFIPNPSNLPQVNHKDENKLNNCVENLEWCDAKYNINYGNGIKKRTIKRSKKVNQYDLDGNFIKEFISTSEVSKVLNISQGNISECCRGKRKSVNGFIWRYANE